MAQFGEPLPIIFARPCDGLGLKLPDGVLTVWSALIWQETVMGKCRNWKEARLLLESWYLLDYLLFFIGGTALGHW